MSDKDEITRTKFLGDLALAFHRSREREREQQGLESLAADAEICPVTGETHDWLDVTTIRDIGRAYLCHHCDAKKADVPER